MYYFSRRRYWADRAFNWISNLINNVESGIGFDGIQSEMSFNNFIIWMTDSEEGEKFLKEIQEERDRKRRNDNA